MWCGIMDNGSKLESGVPGSNSSRVTFTCGQLQLRKVWIHLYSNTAVGKSQGKLGCVYSPVCEAV